MINNAPSVIHLKDYKAPDYQCLNIDLTIDIRKDFTLVTNISEYQISANGKTSELVLDGVGLELQSISVDGSILSENGFNYSGDTLTLTNLPNESFNLETVVKIYPEKNLTGEGLYKSGGIFCTQCEAEGFRRITFHQDRPDVMSLYKTKVIADKNNFPYLLSNGNSIASEDLEGTRHSVTWEDPFKKPSYLFAMVAGDLALVKDTFTTKDKREVSLEIFVDHGNEDKCDHAMKSLKKSMKWDEERFGLIYDLDIYMIVAVDSFNMGAMENKGLNIFNSQYVLAKAQTATDENFYGIESVIGHEYFHNWTGNRVTCRDWFQLTLKEGLTVFRDQEFSADMGSRALTRVSDVSGLKSHQFSEDAGPLSHPIQPKSYIEINNFYTSTIYEKGAEVIRMIHSLLGEVDFRKGMDLYFKRHDGQAVTCADFVSAMADASGHNLDHFSVWYDQNGTPKLDIESSFDSIKKLTTITITQSAKTNNTKYDCLYMPFSFEAYTQAGELIETKQKTLILKTIVTQISIESDDKPILAWNCGFSAPVNINYDYSINELYTLMACANDYYTRYNAAQLVYKDAIDQLVEDHMNGNELKLASSFFTTIEKVLLDESIDDSFREYLLKLPNINDLITQQKNFNFEATDKALCFIKEKIGEKFEPIFLNTIKCFDTESPYVVNQKEIAKRAKLRMAMKFGVLAGNEQLNKKVAEIYESANNMTVELASLGALTHTPFSEQSLKKFYNKWKNETLVFQKWLTVVGATKNITVEKLLEVEKMPEFDGRVPNIIRSLLGSFMNNAVALNRPDGSGYKYIGKHIEKLDSFNPQIAARVARRMNFLGNLDAARAKLLKAEFERLLAIKDLSSDTFEVLNTHLK